MSIQPITPVCSAPVRRPLMLQSWLRLTFLHWPCDPTLIQPLLPRDLMVDTFDGNAWVGLVPFEIRNLRPPGLPASPWVSNFAETNVRTYAIGPDGSRGVWFFSLDAARLLAVIGARLSYRLPYFWAAMQIRGKSAAIEYRSRRKWPRPASDFTEIVIEPGRTFDPAELTDRDHFLTARYRLFTLFGSRLAFAPIEHQPWPLRRANLRELRETLLAAAGLPQPHVDPLVHYAEAIAVRIGAPRLL